MFSISESIQTCTIEGVQDEHEKVVCSENIVYLTGDTHGRFRRIAEFSAMLALTILGTIETGQAKHFFLTFILHFSVSMETMSKGQDLI